MVTMVVVGMSAAHLKDSDVKGVHGALFELQDIFTCFKVEDRNDCF